MKRWDETPEPVDTRELWRGVAYAIPLSLLCWALILGLGYLGWQIGTVL